MRTLEVSMSRINAASISPPGIAALGEQIRERLRRLPARKRRIDECVTDVRNLDDAAFERLEHFVCTQEIVAGGGSDNRRHGVRRRRRDRCRPRQRGLRLARNAGLVIEQSGDVYRSYVSEERVPTQIVMPNCLGGSTQSDSTPRCK
jgi:hypothetical protein